MVQGFGGDMGSLLKQAQEMQRRMQEIEQELAERIVEGSAGGGAVKCTVNGRMELRSIRIDPEAVDPDDVGTLEDLVTVAVRQALQAAKDIADQERARVTGGLNMPGLGF